MYTFSACNEALLACIGESSLCPLSASRSASRKAAWMVCRSCRRQQGRAQVVPVTAPRQDEVRGDLGQGQGNAGLAELQAAAILSPFCVGVGGAAAPPGRAR